MELTDEIWKALGFKKNKARGGFDRWYHNHYLGRSYNYFKYGASVSDGVLSFDCENDRNPKTLQELYKILEEVIKDNGIQKGIAINQGRLRFALGIDE